MAERLQRHVHCLLGLPFDEVDMAGAVSRVRDAAGRRERCFLSTPNLNWLAACLNDPAFRGSVMRSDLSIPDGTPLIWIAKLLGIPLRERVAGSTLFEILRRENPRKISVFFFGGPDGAAEAACQRLNHEGRGLAGAGYESPGFGSVEDMSTGAIVGRINASQADFLVVALGARKGQAWIERNLERLNVPVVSHLGAVVNFVAGTARRAPVWTQQAGLEWLWRIKEEPDLWRRYFLDGMVLLRLLVTRVLPHAWLISRHAPGPRELASAIFECRDTEGEISIQLRGAWVRQNLQPLTECVSTAAMSRKNVRFDLKNASYVDSAFLGLLMLASAELAPHGRRLTIADPPPNVRRIFRYACAEFLLDSPRA